MLSRKQRHKIATKATYKETISCILVALAQPIMARQLHTYLLQEAMMLLATTIIIAVITITAAATTTTTVFLTSKD